jgi:large subunit ribosomal protein L13Ae
MDFLRKRTNTNPKKGPFHHRSPSKILWRTIRGMLPHKTTRGAQALGRLSLFNGIPRPYATMKRKVIPSALRVLRLRPGRKYCVLGDLAAQVGWRQKETIAKLEEKRKIAGNAYIARKRALLRLKAKAIQNVSGGAQKTTKA